MIFGWVSGIFRAFRHKPDLKISLIDGPTFSCTFPTGNTFDEFDAHKTGIALYLKISNRGLASTSIDRIEVGYHWHLRPFSVKWWRYKIGWFWLHEQVTCLTDFQVEIGDQTKVYPFLLQRSYLTGLTGDSYFRSGEQHNGVVYFEQVESFGGCFPSPQNGKTRVQVRVTDTHGNAYSSKFWIPVFELEKAKVYNPKFGNSRAAFDSVELP